MEEIANEDELYEKYVGLLKEATQKGVPFEDAAKSVDVQDHMLRDDIIDSGLKVIIAERHFNGRKTLDALSYDLKLPLARLKKAKNEMMQDVRAAAIDAYKSSGQSGAA